MNEKNNRQAPKRSVLPSLVIVVAIMLFSAVNDPTALVPLVAGLIIAAAIFITVSFIKKAAQNGQDGAARSAGPKVALNRPFPEPKKFAAKARANTPRHADEAEEAIRCEHVRGRQKYIQQLDSYLKNGIIDKAEYKILRERYEKLDIPDDYH